MICTMYLRGVLTNFMTVYAFFSKITTQWWQVRYVSYRYHSKEPNYCTGISLTQVVTDLWNIKPWKILIFAHFFTLTSLQWSLLKWNCDFWVPWNISDQIHGILCPKLFLFFEKMRKVFKNKAQGCCTP